MPLSLTAIRPRRLQIVNPISDSDARAALREYLNTVKREMEYYPPERPETTYARTGRLGSSWSIYIPSRYFGELTNSTYYAGYVQGPRTGASSGEDIDEEGGAAGRVRQRSQFRRWGWKSITDVSRKHAHLFAEAMNRRIASSNDK